MFDRRAHPTVALSPRHRPSVPELVQYRGLLEVRPDLGLDDLAGDRFLEGPDSAEIVRSTSEFGPGRSAIAGSRRNNSTELLQQVERIPDSRFFDHLTADDAVERETRDIDLVKGGGKTEQRPFVCATHRPPKTANGDRGSKHGRGFRRPFRRSRRPSSTATSSMSAYPKPMAVPPSI